MYKEISLCRVGYDIAANGDESRIMIIRDKNVEAILQGKEADAVLGWYKQCRADGEKLKSQMEELVGLCKNAAKVFRCYEALHTAKPDMIKAKSNGDLAENIETALKELGLY